MQREIVFESRNSLDFSQAELDELAQLAREDLAAAGITDVDVRAVAQEPVGVGNTFHDVLQVFLPTEADLHGAVWGAVSAQVTTAMRKRFSKPHEQVRERIIVIRESIDGEVKSVKRLTTADGEVDELNPEDDPRGGQSLLPPPVPPEEHETTDDNGHPSGSS